MRRSMVLLCAAYLAWGLLRSLNDLLITVFQRSHAMLYATAMLVHTTFFLAYVLSCIPAGTLIERRGYRAPLFVALLCLSAGAATCTVAVWNDSFFSCLPGIFAIGMGVAVLQTTGNALVRTMGPAEGTAPRLLLAQSFQAFGAMTLPFCYRGLVSGGHSLPGDFVASLTHLRNIYGLSALGVSALILIFAFTFQERHLPFESRTRATFKDLLRLKPVRYGAAITFLFLGSEATILAVASPIFLESSRHHFPYPADLIGMYWAAVLIGRLCAIRLLSTFSMGLVLRAASAIGAILVLISFFSRGAFAASLVMATGLCNAMVFPAVYGLAVRDLPSADSPRVSAIFSTAMCGGAIIPVLSGALSDHFGVSAGMAAPLLVYVAITCLVGKLSSQATDTTEFKQV